tara:strand:+ start:428 stop:889 length:462 start_codon:yes stop_codon:yes gene_type:complete
MKTLELDRKMIHDYQQNRDPYLMIDHATEIRPGLSARGYKDFKNNEWFFKVHWKNDPNVPGMLQIESLVQMAALAILSLPGNKGKVVYLTSATNLKFIKKITPDSRLNIHTKIKSFKRGIALCEGKGMIGENLACKAEFSLILPDEINKYILK